MLGVLKRRWKPKRSSNVDGNSPLGETRLVAPSVRQVHPVCDEKAQLLAYDKCDGGGGGKRSSLGEVNGSPPPYPKRASLESNPSPTYPLTPNICVEGGRIEFIKPPPEGDTAATTPTETTTTPPATPRVARVTVTRALQTDDADNKCEDTKEKLETRVAELEAALDDAQKTEQRDKQTIAKLQKQIAKREATQRDADRERRLRADSESRAKLALQEAARNRSRLKLEIARMEETVLSMLAYKKQSEQLRQEKAALTIAFENRCQQYQNTITRLNQEIFSLRQQIEQSCNNLENSTATQALLMQKQAEESRKQYERCLDDVANQVVRALVTQKGLKEEVTVLNSRIQDLEAQNCTLTSMLVHQLNDPPNHLALEDSHSEDNNTSADASPSNLMRSSLTFRHCNSFDSDILDSKGELKSKDPGLSLEDKKRHHVLTKLWTELKGTEVTPKRLIEALSAVDSALWIPPQRPVSLNLQLPILQASKYRRSKPILAQSKSEEETGNESPESGNRDEGYSTMSSDVQAEVTRTGGVGDSQLEDLKEEDVETRLLASENNKDPEVIYIPINLLNNLKPRNSFPPGKDLLPFQHIMRSFSDSHLCIKITTAPSPCYTFSSPISSSPSILLLDLSDKSINPLRRTKATSLLVDGEKNESPGSWSSFADERVECSTMDAEYIQHWLKLDDTRSNLQQQHRDLFELEYDHNELEDWSLNISNELDSTRLEHWKKSQTGDAITPGQISQISTLPSIQENNAFELEEDSSEILWNESSYMVGQDVVTLLMDGEKQWPYATSSNIHHSPDSSWSSASDCCNSQNDPSSKRSSAALSGCCSDDTGELPAIETYFTRDYYRLVKFESTKSLASSSSRSLGGGGCGGGALSENGERETALQNVLTFIAEQQKYTRESNPMEAVATKEFNIEAPPPQAGDDIKATPCDVQQPKIAYADEVCLVTPIDIIESESCSMLSEHPVDICSSINVELSSTEYQKDSELSESLTSSVSTPETIVSKIPRRKSSKIPISPAKSLKQGGAKGASRIPHRTAKPKPEIKVKSPEHQQQQQQQSAITSERLPQSTSGVVSDIIDGPPHRAVSFHERATSKDVIDELNRMIKNGNDASQEHLDVTTTCLDEACRATGWIHVERDVDLTDPKHVRSRSLSKVYFPKNVEYDRANEEKHVYQKIVRADLCDVMLTSVSSDSSPTSSCGGSVSSESTEEPPDYGQLHRIHRYHRQKKANAARPELAVVRASAPSFRPSIIGRPDFYVRYGEKEREAVASFDFLDDFSTSGSCSGSMDEQVVVIQKQQQQHNHQHHNKQQQIGD